MADKVCIQNSLPAIQCKKAKKTNNRMKIMSAIDSTIMENAVEKSLVKMSATPNNCTTYCCQLA